MSQAQKMLVSLAATLVLAAAIGGYAYFGVFQAEKEELAAKESEEKLFPFDPEAVTSLSLHRLGEETIELEKGPEGWRIVSPLSAPADELEVQKILRDLGWARQLRHIQDEGDMKPFGLEKPLLKVEARTAEGETAHLAVGLRNTFDSTYFVSRAPGQVVTANSLVKTTLEKTVFDLREKKVIPLKTGDVEGIEIEGEKRVALALQEGIWQMLAPHEGRADEKETKSLLRTLIDIRASGFPAREEKDLGDPTFRLTLTPKEGEPVRVRFWEAEEESYAEVEGGVFAAIPTTTLSPLRQDPEELLDQRIAPFDTDKVAKVEVRTTEESFTLRRTDEGWTIEEPKEAPARRWKVNAGITNLSELKPVETLPAEEAAAYGLDEPSRTIRLFDPEGGLVGAYHFGIEKDRHTYVRLEGREEIFKVRENLVINVPRTLADVEEEQEDS